MVNGNSGFESAVTVILNALTVHFYKSQRELQTILKPLLAVNIAQNSFIVDNCC